MIVTFPGHTRLFFVECIKMFSMIFIKHFKSSNFRSVQLDKDEFDSDT